jgi:hypothetical protein
LASRGIARADDPAFCRAPVWSLTTLATAPVECREADRRGSIEELEREDENGSDGWRANIMRTSFGWSSF